MQNGAWILPMNMVQENTSSGCHICNTWIGREIGLDNRVQKETDVSTIVFSWKILFGRNISYLVISSNCSSSLQTTRISKLNKMVSQVK